MPSPKPPLSSRESKNHREEREERIAGMIKRAQQHRPAQRMIEQADDVKAQPQTKPRRRNR